MTSYSVLPSAQRATVLATWPGPWFDHSANVTTVGDSELAAYLASFLTRLSEDAWDAAAFLDASPALEAGISALIAQLRGPADKIEPVTLPGGGCRHADQWSFTDAAEALASDAPAALGELTRPQRLTVADELGRRRARQRGTDPGRRERPGVRALEGVADVRGHQDHAQRPDRAAPGRGRRLAGPRVGAGPRPGRAVGRPRPARAHRAARRGVPGARRARFRPGRSPPGSPGPPPPAPAGRDEVVYVSAHQGTRNSWGTSPNAAMTVTTRRGYPSEQVNLGELDPRDDDGFARVLGEWTRQVPFWPGSQAAPMPSLP